MPMSHAVPPEKYTVTKHEQVRPLRKYPVSYADTRLSMRESAASAAFILQRSIIHKEPSPFKFAGMPSVYARASPTSQPRCSFVGVFTFARRRKEDKNIKPQELTPTSGSYVHGRPPYRLLQKNRGMSLPHTCMRYPVITPPMSRPNTSFTRNCTCIRFAFRREWNPIQLSHAFDNIIFPHSQQPRAVRF
jgi:hypothetical protein